MNLEANFRALTHKIAEGLTAENVEMIRYLCKDAVQHSMKFKDGLSFFEYFETKGWINPADMTFLAEVLYRINRHDLLKRLPGVKNRKDYEQNFLNCQSAQNFTPFRIACFQLIDELTSSDFKILKNYCRNKLSKRNFEKSIDVISLLVCLEEEDYLYDGDLEFILECLRHLDNQIPYKTFYRLSQGDFSIVLPKIHQSQYTLPETPVGFQSPFHHSYSLPSNNKGSQHYSSSKSDSNIATSSNFYPYQPNVTGKEKFFIGPPPSSIPNDEDRTFSEEQPQKHRTSTNPSLYHPFNHSYSPFPPSDQTRPFEIGLQPSDDKDVPHLPPSNTNSENDDLPSNFNSMKLIQCSYVNLPEEKKVLLPKQPQTNTEMQTDALLLYPMKNRPTGICLIINNCDFESCNHEPNFHGSNQKALDINLKNRTGSEKDVSSVETLFKSFGFEVQVFVDLEAKEIQDKLEKTARLSHDSFDCFVLVIMTHGGKGLVYGVDKKPILLADIRKCFKPESCPTLEGKPKIFFIQACQTDPSFAQVGAPIADLEMDGFGSGNPPEADFLICYSSVPGYPSYRSRSRGSFYIQAMVRNLAKYYKKQDVLSIMVQVNNEMADLQLGQIAMPIATLRRKIFFNCVDHALLSSIVCNN